MLFERMVDGILRGKVASHRKAKNIWLPYKNSVIRELATGLQGFPTIGQPTCRSIVNLHSTTSIIFELITSSITNRDIVERSFFNMPFKKPCIVLFDSLLKTDLGHLRK